MLLQGLPVQPQKAPPAVPLPPVGTDAARVLKDSLTTLPRTAEHWVVGVAAAFVRLLPRLLIALAAAAVILGLTLWVRRRLHGQARHAGALGLLLAATIAALILGASRVAAASLTLWIFIAAAEAVRIIGTRVFSRSQISAEAVDLVISVLRAALMTLGVVEAQRHRAEPGWRDRRTGDRRPRVRVRRPGFAGDLIAGFTILWERPLRVGDWIRVGDGATVGRVAHLTLRTTRLATLQDGLLIIPNKDITGSRLYNLSHENGSTFRLMVSVPTSTGLERARTSARRARSAHR